MAQALYRLRNDPEAHWRGPGVKDNDAAFAAWAANEIGKDPSYARKLLYGGRALAEIETGNLFLKEQIPTPATSGQVWQLGALYRLPAIGMVLTPSLPRRRGRWTDRHPSAGPTS